MCPLDLGVPLRLEPGEVASAELSLFDPERYGVRFQARASTEAEQPIIRAATEFVLR